MKRGCSGLFTLESRMRKQAMLELKAQQKREEEDRIKQIRLNAEKIKLDEHGNTLYTLDSLPSTRIHLGGGNFLCLVSFIGHTRVHIRSFHTDDDGYLHPTKDGVSLSPKVWYSFQQRVSLFCFRDQPLVVENDLQVTRVEKDGKALYIFQRMFQRKNLFFEFLQEGVILSSDEMEHLKDSKSNINTQVKENVLKYTVKCYVHKECEGNSKVMEENHKHSVFECELNVHTEQYFESLSECFCTALNAKISDLFKCFACEKGYPNTEFHACKSVSRAEIYDDYFDMSFYELNLQNIAKDFLNANMNCICLSNMNDFFDFLDVKVFFENVRKIYVNFEEEEESGYTNVPENLFMCLE